MQPCLGWFLCCFIQSWGKKFISNPTLLSTSQQMAKVLCYQLMWTPAWEDQGKLLPGLSIKCCSNTVRAVFMPRHTKEQSPPYTCWSQLYFSYTGRDKTPQRHFHHHPLASTLWRKDESTTGRLGASPQDSRFCQALKGRNIFQLERADPFFGAHQTAEVFQLCAVVEQDGDEGHWSAWIPALTWAPVWLSRAERPNQVKFLVGRIPNLHFD